jgi:beta-glucosidase
MKTHNILYGLLVIVTLLTTSCSRKKLLPYQNEKLSVEERVNDLVSRMTLDEKIKMVSGYNTFYTYPVPRLHIPSLKMADISGGEGKSTAFPVGVSLAAAWDTSLVNQIGKGFGTEFRAKGKNVALSPCVNIQRFAGGGRNFESYGEDPYLASRMAVAFIKGIQSEGVMATVKHFACNNYEYDRLFHNVIADERTLNEIYFPAFKAAVQEGGSKAVMTAYNKVNGNFCSENKFLINETLKKDWGFTGIVMSDWNATHSVAPAFNAGLDLEMPGQEYFKPDTLRQLLKLGLINEKTLNDKVSRMLRAMFEMGFMDKKVEKSVAIDTLAHRQLALKGAEEGIVLLKNFNNLLPLSLKKVHKIAVIGPNAILSNVCGGGSSSISPYSFITPLQGLKDRVGDSAVIVYEPGLSTDFHGKVIDSKYFVPYLGSKQHGLTAEYYTNLKFKGEPYYTGIDSTIDFNWNNNPDHLPATVVDSFSVRWSGYIVAPQTGIYRLALSSDDGSKLYINGKQVIDNWSIQSLRTKITKIALEKDKPTKIAIEFFENTGAAGIRFEWELLRDHKAHERAVKAAKDADVVLFFGGLSPEFESEGWDNPELLLPPGQDSLINDVAEANPNTIVTLFGGIGLNMSSWINKVPAVLQAWYPGQEGGQALAEILTGDISPSGKLPVTFVIKPQDSPSYSSYPPTAGNVVYKEGIYVGYRYFEHKNLPVRFPFGHGLSYTKFRYSNIDIKQTAKDSFTVSCMVKNTGNYNADEVVQVYVQDDKSELDRPLKELKGFARIHLKQGEQQIVKIHLSPSSFSYFNPNTKKWTLEPGTFTVHIGSSSADIRLKKSLTIK